MNTEVELTSSLEEALLKGCPWMSIGIGEKSEGEKDEASQQHAPPVQQSAVQESRAMSLLN